MQVQILWFQKKKLDLEIPLNCFIWVTILLLLSTRNFALNFRTATKLLVFCQPALQSCQKLGKKENADRVTDGWNKMLISYELKNVSQLTLISRYMDDPFIFIIWFRNFGHTTTNENSFNKKEWSLMESVSGFIACKSHSPLLNKI